MATVPLVHLVDSLLQKAYHDLTILQELLRNKSDGDRKVEIVKYAQRTRALLIRLLALVKWAGNSNSVQKCSEMSMMLNQQSGLYVDTADQLVHLIRQTLVNACTPNFNLAPALDVLSTGTYPRLPMCIKDRIIVLPSLEEEEELEAHDLINCAIRRRLLGETIPENMIVTSIGDGMINFKVPYEFEMNLSVVSGELDTPWRLISLKILVSEALPDKPVLIHQHQKLYLHQVVQSRLYTETNPLQDCYECLHAFCLSLCLDCLYSQANQLSHNVYGGYTKVEDYSFGHHLKIVYWRPGSSQFMSAFLLDQSRTVSWPKILISIDPSQSLCPYSTHHSPPLPEGTKVVIRPDNLSLESLLKECVRVRSHSRLKDIKAVLDDTIWNNEVELLETPLCLRIRVPLKYDTRHLVLGVDPRVGNIVASINPVCSVGGVSACLEELEKVVTSTWSSLPTQLARLQCQLFVGHVSEIAETLHLPIHWSLPLVDPLPFHTSAVLYLELQPLTYLVVSVVEGLLDQYHLLSLSPTYYGSSSNNTPDTPPTPKSYFSISSLVELDPDEVSLQHLRTVMVMKSGALLKRKLRESTLNLPSLKRVCLGQSPNFSPLPGLIMARMVLLSMETSLNAVGISHHVTYNDFGSPCANIFNFPQFDGDMDLILSSSLRSCQVTPSPSGYSSTFVFSPLDLGGKVGGDRHGDDIILRQFSESNSSDLGQTLVGQWKARLCLLGLTLELHQYLNDMHWPLNNRCTMSEFTYDELSVTFGKHSLLIKATPTGLSLSLPSDCPHSLVQTSLETFLQNTQSLPLLLQGMSSTEYVMSILVRFVEKMPAMTVSATSPSQIHLNYENFTLIFSLQSNSTVAFNDMRYSKPSGVPALQINPLSYLQTFLYFTLSLTNTDSDDTSEEIGSIPTSTTPHKLALYPSPSPISFPSRRISWTDSVPSPRGFSIPSIPSFPSPAVGSRMGQGNSWNFPLSLDQFDQLLSATPSHPVKPDTCVDGCSLLESFLGGLSLLFHAIYLANKQYISFVQCDRGTYTYRADAISITFSMEGSLLRTTLKQTRENVWSDMELEVLMKFFKREVMVPPFSINGIHSFIILLTLPLTVLKNCVQMIQQQQSPPASGMIWCYSLCLCIPSGADLAGIPFSIGGPAVHYGRGKLLLFLKFERIQDKLSFILPLMFDPKANFPYIGRFSNQYRNTLHPHIDSILRKASGEYISQLSGQPGHPSSSLYHAVHTLAQSTLPIQH